MSKSPALKILYMFSISLTLGIPTGCRDGGKSLEMASESTKNPKKADDSKNPENPSAATGHTLDCIKADLDPRNQNNICDCALHYAIERDDIESVQTLIENGFNPNKRYLLDGKYFNFRNFNDVKMHSKPPLFLAIEKNNEKIVKYLLDNNADPNASYLDKSLLFLAIEQKNASVVKSLWDKGANPRASYLGRTD